MDIHTAASQINYMAVIAAAMSSFVLGGLWYSPVLFGKAWMRATGITPDQAQSGHPAKVFGLSFVLALLGAYAFAVFLNLIQGQNPDLGHALITGLIVGIFWIAGSFGINYLFEQKSLKLWLVNSGYHIAQYALYGLILGLWH